MVKRTFQPHNIKRKRTHGFRARKRKGGGVTRRRRTRGRHRLAP